MCPAIAGNYLCVRHVAFQIWYATLAAFIVSTDCACWSLDVYSCISCLSLKDKQKLFINFNFLQQEYMFYSSNSCSSNRIRAEHSSSSSATCTSCGEPHSCCAFSTAEDAEEPRPSARWRRDAHCKMLKSSGCEG